MSNLDPSSCKKRRRGERVFRFQSFGVNGYPIELTGSFMQNVKKLLELGNFDGNNFFLGGLPSWSFQLEVNQQPPFHILLLVLEEPIEASHEPQCKHCQYIGWGHHMVCNEKYHFVLPSKETVTAYFNICDDFDYCKNNTFGTTSKGTKLNFVELKGHVMHGVFHSNGFGHLLFVNGIENASNLSGRQIMDFWDRLCVGLHARKVSLCDISSKQNMELRLIHAIAYGEPWFGRWGFKFGRGTYGVTQQMYQKAIEAIQGMPLCVLTTYLGNSNQDISMIVSRYQMLSDHSLTTLGDLFNFMFELKARLPKENCVDSCNSNTFGDRNCRWSPKRIEMATRVIIESLKRANSRWVSRQEVRDASRIYIGDTGLLDFVLKSLGNHIVGNYLVRRSLNPVTKVLEYSLEDVSNVFPDQNAGLVNQNSTSRYKMTRTQLIKDMGYLYKHILVNKDKKLLPLHDGTILSAIPTFSRVILDAKYFIREYNVDYPMDFEGNNNKLRLYCTIVLRTNSAIDDDQLNNRSIMPPLECITLKNIDATFDDLKQEAEKKFRELYYGLRCFNVEAVMNMNVKGTDHVLGHVEGGKRVVVVGRNMDNNDLILYEDGANNNRVVDCLCGAKSDDGERLLACDICEVWQHTRCVRIPNNQQLPTVFLCNRCEHGIIISPCLP